MADIAVVLKELEQERDRLDKAITALMPLVGMNANRGRGATSARRTLSAAARQRIAAAQRARWARVKSGKADSRSKKPGTRAVSAAARRKMAAAQRARRARE